MQYAVVQWKLDSLYLILGFRLEFVIDRLKVEVVLQGGIKDAARPFSFLFLIILSLGKMSGLNGNLLAWSPEDVARFLEVIGFPQMRVAALQRAGTDPKIPNLRLVFYNIDNAAAYLSKEQCFYLF